MNNPIVEVLAVFGLIFVPVFWIAVNFRIALGIDGSRLGSGKKFLVAFGATALLVLAIFLASSAYFGALELYINWADGPKTSPTVSYAMFGLAISIPIACLVNFFVVLKGLRGAAVARADSQSKEGKRLRRLDMILGSIGVPMLMIFLVSMVISKRYCSGGTCDFVNAPVPCRQGQRFDQKCLRKMVEKVKDYEECRGILAFAKVGPGYPEGEMLCRMKFMPPMPGFKRPDEK